MAFDPATLLSRTVAGDAELSTPRNGLSLGQRKLLTFLDQPQALEEMAAGRALEATKLERDLAKLASLNLIAVNGHGVPPAAVGVVIGGARPASLLRWVLPPLLLAGVGLVYFAMGAPSPRKAEAPATRLSAAPAMPAATPASTATPIVATVAAITEAAAVTGAAGTGRDTVPARGAPARTLPEPLPTASVSTKALPPDTFKSTPTEATARTPAAGETTRAADTTRSGANAPADAGNVRAVADTSRATADSSASLPVAALPASHGERASANSAPAGAVSTAAAAPASATIAAAGVAKVPAAAAAAAGAAAPANAAAVATTVAAAATANANVAAPPPNPASPPQPSASVAPAPVKLALAAPAAPVAHAPVALKLLPLTREDPEFPREALVRGVSSGSVKARLAIDAAGKVTTVSIVDARPSRVFDRAVTQALSRWTFPAGDAGRSTEVEIAFKRD